MAVRTEATEALVSRLASGKLPVRKKGLMVSRRTQGFSLIEMMIVMAVFLIASAIASMFIQPMLMQARVTNAYNITLATMRQARDISVAQRQIFFVTLTGGTPSQISITQGSTGVVTATYALPRYVGFVVQAGLPGSPNTPDGFGNAALAIDFDQGIAGGAKNVIYFYPDGSSEDVVGNINNGVVYIARTGQLYSSHAITLWGATGRLRGWRLYNSSGVPYWRQM
jgi:prepilin-type N-terminal cleavage/methylation domain-containing protein